MYRVFRSYRSTRENLKEREMLREHEPQHFRVLPNFHECFYLTIRLFALDFCEVIVDSALSLNFIYIISNYFQDFKMKVVTAKCKI